MARRHGYFQVERESSQIARKITLNAGSGNFLDRNFNINDDDDKNYDDDDEEDCDEEESIEELVQRVEGEKADATRKMKQEEDRRRRMC